MNKGYINIVLALLSVLGFIKIIEFVNERKTITISSNEENMDGFPISPNEAKQAIDVMAEALYVAKKHAIHTNDYELYSKDDDGAILYFKRVNDTDIGKLELTIPNPNNYADIVNKLWNINGAKNFDDEFIEGRASRIYDQNLLIVQQRYKSHLKTWQRYYHALANKVELSKDETAILLVSSDMNDHYRGSKRKYVNPIVKSANTFKPDIYSQKDIRKGKIFKMYVNLVAFFIKKETDCVKVTYISSINLNFHPKSAYEFIKKVKAKNILKFINLKNNFKK
ncbi:fam-a protein [Plasmodium vinckei vinckei]|uniref:Fam-a protein n=1 Tax=Plasmodium vinckei vinckei TaxID=54757 RepID=A0A449BY38_PLAVN|nr:fam-a protein [Plasmodium vinckei vinckei]KEG04703.1 hypothetical protein YYE_00278 [Plasmodium vinckei vinckei]VEV58353.1 fam-a protein [Plasmodium vinckei vinckei]